MTPFVRSLERFARGGGTMPAVREMAFKRFAERGLPGPDDEEWKYTSLGPISDVQFEPAAPGAALEAPELALAQGFAHRIVFVDGRHRAELSTAVEGACALGGAPAALVSRELGRHADFRRDALAALNTALFEDAAIVHLRGVLPAPIHLLLLSSASARPVLSHPRVLIVAEPGSEATVVETWAGPGDGVYFNNAVTEIVLGAGARLEHCKLQQEGARAFHLATTQVTIGPAAQFTSRSLALGGILARNEVRVLFADEGGECTLDGLYMGTGAQHLDNRTFVDHKSPRCTSRELYKGVLDGEARGVFGGRVLVRENAFKTDARQVNRNLLLSESAVVDTKPQLEIFNDDVKCAHGAAVGDLDADALFYLRSRGLSVPAARSLLTWAFASEIVERLPVPALRARARELVISRLPDQAGLLEAA